MVSMALIPTAGVGASSVAKPLKHAFMTAIVTWPSYSSVSGLCVSSDVGIRERASALSLFFPGRYLMSN